MTFSATAAIKDTTSQETKHSRITFCAVSVSVLLQFCSNFPFSAPREEHEGGVQVPRRVGLVRAEDVLAERGLLQSGESVAVLGGGGGEEASFGLGDTSVDSLSAWVRFAV